jgi:hypothetical protein
VTAWSWSSSSECEWDAEAEAEAEARGVVAARAGGVVGWATPAGQCLCNVKGARWRCGKREEGLPVVVVGFANAALRCGDGVDGLSGQERRGG